MAASGLVGRRVRGAFTLIELLVVIAVISILLGVLMAALPGVRDSARSMGCGSNQRQVGLAIEMFKGENKNKYPDARYMPDPWISGMTELESLNEALDPYMEEKSEGWRCPGDNEVFDVLYTDENGREQKGGSSYMFMTVLSGKTFEESWFHERLHWQTTEHPVIHDYDGSNLTYRPVMGSDDFIDLNPGFFHRTRSILFADGHVGTFE